MKPDRRHTRSGSRRSPICFSKPHESVGHKALEALSPPFPESKPSEAGSIRKRGATECKELSRIARTRQHEVCDELVRPPGIFASARL